MVPETNLKSRCKVVTNKEGDRFVGVRAVSSGVNVSFPLGYQQPDEENALRSDIIRLLHILASFNKTERELESPHSSQTQKIDFPIHDYLTIIQDYLRRGRYYVETEPIYSTNTKGRVSWSRTIRRQRAFMQPDGVLIFNKMSIRTNQPNHNNDITRIHQYCVYEAFRKLGWLYVSFLPQKPEQYPHPEKALHILCGKLHNTHNDQDSAILSAMIAMLRHEARAGTTTDFIYGTYLFEKVWEWMIDRAFGQSDKKQYFPRTRWLLLSHKKQQENVPLYPDSIMTCHGNYYVLDAKYYRYGCTALPGDLPNGSDINKQITYGEYIVNARHIPAATAATVFNCFIMPYNMTNNHLAVSEVVENIGEAVGDWRRRGYSIPHVYERIQGIVMDTRTLMLCYDNSAKNLKRKLAAAIEQVLTRSVQYTSASNRQAESARLIMPPSS